MRIYPLISLVIVGTALAHALPSAVSANTAASATNTVITAAADFAPLKTSARQHAAHSARTATRSHTAARNTEASVSRSTRRTPQPLPLACVDTATPPPPADNTPVKGTQATPAYLVSRNADGKVIAVNANPEASTPLHANAPLTSKPADNPGNLAWQLINTLLKLALVLVLAYVALLTLKKYQQGGRSSLRGLPKFGKSQRVIHVLETASIGQGRTLHLLMVGGRVLLVGAAGQQINLLGDVTDDAEVQAMMNGSNDNTPSGQGFGNLLSRFLTPQGDLPAGPQNTSQQFAAQVMSHLSQQGGRS